MTNPQPKNSYSKGFFGKRLRLASLLVVLLLAGALVVWRGGYPAFLLHSGRDALTSHQIPVALEVLGRAERLSPQDPEIQFHLARASRLSGRFGEMQAHLRKGQAFGLSAERLRREQVLAMAQSGKIRETETQLAELFASPGDDGQAICEAVVSGMFLCYRLKDAFTILEAWRRDFPKDSQPDVVEGMYNFQKRVYLRAAELFERALRLEPQRHDVRLQLAESLRQLHRLDDASLHYQKCLDASPHNPDILVGYGRCLLEQGNLMQSRSVLNRAIQLSPKHANGSLMMAKLLVADGVASEALPYAEVAYAQMPYEPEVRYVLAQSLQGAGREKEAREQFEFVAAQQQAQSKLRNMLEELEGNPAQVDLRCNVGETLLEYGNPDEGVGWLQSVLEYVPNHSRACLALAKHFRKKGLTAEAEAMEKRGMGDDSGANEASP
jgi:tetratricopeptide (TPR) repeat protein